VEIFVLARQDTVDGAWTLRARKEATDTNSEYVNVILIAFPQQQWLHECASMLHYMYIPSLANLNNEGRATNSAVSVSMGEVPDYCKMNVASECQLFLIITFCLSVSEPHSAAS
jgi:hypothetical protein